MGSKQDKLKNNNSLQEEDNKKEYSLDELEELQKRKEEGLPVGNDSTVEAKTEEQDSAEEDKKDDEEADEGQQEADEQEEEIEEEVEEKEEEEEEIVEESIDGTAAIEEGKLVVENPQGEGEPAYVVPTEGIELWINGEKIEEKHPIYGEDEVELKVIEDIRPMKIEVKRLKDDMMAEVEVAPEYKINYTLLNKKSSNLLTIATEKEEEINRLPTEEDIKEVLEENSVVYGLDESSIAKLAQSEEPTSEVVAKGLPVQEGIDGYIEYVVRTEMELVESDEEAMKVNLRERYYIPQVEEGEVIGIIYPPEEGIPGCKVTGEEVPPAPVHEKSISCNEGAEMSEDESQVIATITGRPVVNKGQTDIVGVDKFFVHNGDVDMESGNLHFNGHLRVEGAVEEGMTVFANGDIIISGSVASAYIIGGGEVNINGNSINSNVKAGGAQLLYQEIAEILKSLKISLEAALNNIDQLTQLLESRGDLSPEKYPLMVYKLFQTKFSEIFEFIDKINNIIEEKKEFSLPDKPLENIEKLTYFFKVKGVMEVDSERPVRNMFNLTDEALIELLSVAEETSNIAVNYVQNSELECTGDIYVSGPGAYYTTLQCGGNVHVNNVFRAGQIVAGGDISIGELGSPGSTYSYGLVEVTADHSIQLGKVYEGARVKVGDHLHRLDSTYSNIKIYLNKEEDKVKVVYC